LRTLSQRVRVDHQAFIFENRTVIARTKRQPNTKGYFVLLKYTLAVVGGKPGSRVAVTARRDLPRKACAERGDNRESNTANH
jgi:hypothetical protein